MFSEREELLKALRSNPVTLRTLVRGLSDAELRRRPADGEWSVLEVVAHLGDTEERTIARVRRMLDEDNPTLPGYDQEALAIERRYNEMDFDEALERFERLRAEHVALLESLDGEAWQRRGTHTEQGPMTIQTFESHSVGEDSDHMAQIARLIP